MRRRCPRIAAISRQEWPKWWEGGWRHRRLWAWLSGDGTGKCGCRCATRALCRKRKIFGSISSLLFPLKNMPLGRQNVILSQPPCLKEATRRQGNDGRKIVRHRVNGKKQRYQPQWSKSQLAERCPQPSAFAALYMSQTKDSSPSWAETTLSQTSIGGICP